MSTSLLSDTLVPHRLTAWRADTRAGGIIEYLWEGTRFGRAAVAARERHGNKRRSSLDLPLADGEGPRPPVAEAVLVVAVGARSGLDTPLLVHDVAASLAAAAEVVQVAYGTEPNLPPASPDELVDQHAPGTPDLSAGYAGRVLAEQVITRASIDGWPVEDIVGS